MLKTFCEVSSCDGIVDLYEAKHNKCKFAFWAMVMTGMVGTSIYFTYAIIRGYVTTPSVTNVALVHEKVIDLPELMLCYNGGMNISAMLEVGFSTVLARVFASKFYVKATEDINQELIIHKLTHNLSMKDLYKQFSYKCEDMVKNFSFPTSSYDYKETGCDHATSLWSSRGLCYLFNSNFKQYNPVDIGFDITLKQLPVTEQNVFSEYELMSMLVTNDYSIAIQKSFDNQFCFDGVLYIPLNSFVKISLNPRRYIRYKSNSCDSGNETYSSNTCYDNCFQDAYVQSCQCQTIAAGGTARHSKYDYCDLLNESNCEPQFDNYDYNKCVDDCLPKCDEWLFEYQVTSSRYSNKEINENSTSRIWIQHEKMLYIKIEEVEAFTIDMAIANVGGQFGLWLGASFVTIIQAVYYLVLAIAEKIGKNKTEPIGTFKKKATVLKLRETVNLRY